MARVDHLGISVSDLERSLGFYTDLLGAALLVAPRQVEEYGFRRAIVLFDGPMVLDVNEHGANTGEPFHPARTGLDHLALGASSSDALEAWAARLDAHGVARSPIRAVDGVGERFDFRDPDGIQLEFWHMDWKGTWKSHLQRTLERRRPDRR